MSKKAGEGRRTNDHSAGPQAHKCHQHGLTTLPPVHVIKAALLNFDEFAVSKDGIEVGIHSEGCGELGLSLVGGHFLPPPVVGMGLAFLQSSLQT